MNRCNVLVILAAGLGVRYCSDIPKQYTYINGVELLDLSVKEMVLSKNSDHIVLVLNDDKEAVQLARKSYPVDVIIGGADRAHSFQNAIDYISATYLSCKKVVFHEAARPLVGHEYIDRYFELLDEYDYVETCSKIVDSLGSCIMKSPRREDFYLIQAPEAYRLETLKRYYDCESRIYFAANQFPETCKGLQFFGIHHNFKLTTPEDRVLIEALLKERRSGDVDG